MLANRTSHTRGFCMIASAALRPGALLGYRYLATCILHMLEGGSNGFHSKGSLSRIRRSVKFLGVPMRIETLTMAQRAHAESG